LAIGREATIIPFENIANIKIDTIALINANTKNGWCGCEKK
jgi:hypothetical protein